MDHDNIRKLAELYVNGKAQLRHSVPRRYGAKLFHELPFYIHVVRNGDLNLHGDYKEISVARGRDLLGSPLLGNKEAATALIHAIEKLGGRI